jgi:hypothetical protein
MRSIIRVEEIFKIKNTQKHNIEEFSITPVHMDEYHPSIFWPQIRFFPHPRGQELVFSPNFSRAGASLMCGSI